MTAIIVSGTPGTGKTTLAKDLAKKLKFRYIDVNRVIREHDLSEGIDKERKSKLINVAKLRKALNTIIKENDNVIIDSHLSHELQPNKVNLCIITKCELKSLKKRLEKRRYNKKKVRENLDAEIFDICRSEAMERGHEILTIDTTKKLNMRVITHEVSTFIN